MLADTAIATQGPGDELADLRVLERGDAPVDVAALARAIASIVGMRASEVARDRNAICYRVRLEAVQPAAFAIVKVPREGPQRTNADTTFGGEARVLAALPAAGIVAAPLLIARVAAAGRHYLFTTEVPGRHPHPSSNRLDGPQLRAILRHLLVMDRQRFMHYDLKAANILTRRGDASFIDFEFSVFADGQVTDASFCQDFNVALNPALQARSNVANFEFRALHRYLLDLEATAPMRAAATLGAWLRAKSGYHRQMAASLAAQADTATGLPVAPLSPPACADATSFERLLADLYARPSAAIDRVERGLMAFRCATFERDSDAAARALAATDEAVARDARSARLLPDEFVAAARRVLRLVAKSVHPDAAIERCASS